MEWIEVSISTSQEAAELVSNFLIELGSQGVVLEDNSFPETEKGVGGKAEDCIIKGYFPDTADLTEVTDQVGAYLAMLECSRIRIGSKGIQTRVVQEEDWESSWKKYFKPIQLGRRLVIKPAWEPYEAKSNQVVIDMDPGMAFGTGRHETTQLCLELLEEGIYPGACVLDVGTGSGILAIAAAKLGASQVLGLDTDPVALQYAEENLIKNAVQSRVSLQEGSLNRLNNIDRSFDLIVMNIRPQVILSFVEPLKGYLKPGGILILSGILQSEVQGFTEALRAMQLTVKEQRSKGEWIALICA